MSDPSFDRLLRWLIVFLAPALVQACAPRQAYRSPAPTARATPSAQSSTDGSLSSARPEVSQPKPLAEGAKIKEQDLRENRTAPQERAKGQQLAPDREAAPLPDDSSILAKITPKTPPQRAASLRLTEEGRKLLTSGDSARALDRFEKAISVDSTNPYGYYYLAQAHYRLGRYQESLNFLEVAESQFGSESYWLSETLALKGENYRALGFSQKADQSYAQALRLNPGNRVATERLNRSPSETETTSY